MHWEYKLGAVLTAPISDHEAAAGKFFGSAGVRVGM